MRTANPALNEQAFETSRVGASIGSGRMTLDGTVNRTGILVLLASIAAAWPWHLYSASVRATPGWEGAAPAGNPGVVMPWLIGGAIGGLIFALVTAFKKHWAPITAPIYAILEGFFLGAISAIFEARYSGIVVQAVALTLGTTLALLLAYKSGVIRATENFKLGVVAATGGIFLVYLASWILGFFGISIGFLHGSGLFGIGFSLFVVVIAALNLVLDFDFIERGSEQGLPKHMEWYAAFGLMVTLVWLYVEFLRLLAKLNDRR